MPEYCDTCEYKIYNECHPCPNNTYPKKCSYHKAFIRMILRIKEFRVLFENAIKEASEKKCNCSDGCCGDNCSCEKPNNCEPQCNSWR